MTVVGVYTITNIVNGKVYIGSTINFERRWNEHTYALHQNKHDNPYLQHAWNKYGESTFEFGILEYLDNFKMLIETEQFWMDIYRLEGKELYNCGIVADCPMRGRKHTEESKRKISESKLGHIISEETRRKISITKSGKPSGRLGKKHTKEARLRMSISAKVRCARDGKSGGMLGKNHSEETRRKMSKSQLGRSVSEETRRKISEALMGRKFSKEHRRKLSEARKGLTKERVASRSNSVIFTRQPPLHRLARNNIEIISGRRYRVIW